jgi:hypothetical protein
MKRVIDGSHFSHALKSHAAGGLILGDNICHRSLKLGRPSGGLNKNGKQCSYGVQKPHLEPLSVLSSL